MTVTQRIGWDPLTKQIKSWVFDSEGGYGDGLWTRKGNQWVIKSTGVLPDGRIAHGHQHPDPSRPQLGALELDRTNRGRPEHRRAGRIRDGPQAAAPRVQIESTDSTRITQAETGGGRHDSNQSRLHARRTHRR